MTNTRETSVMLPVEPSDAVIIGVQEFWETFFNTPVREDSVIAVYRAIIAAHIQEQDA